MDNEKGGYHAAPKKKSQPDLPEKTSDDTIEQARWLKRISSSERDYKKNRLAIIDLE